MTYFSGQVVDIIWENPANSFYILKMALDSAKEKATPQPKAVGDDLDLDDSINAFQDMVMSTTVKGTISGIEVSIGTWFGFDAKWINDKKYGRQLQIQRAPVIEGEWTPQIVAAMLPCETVGPFIARALLAHFGDKLLEALNDVGKIQECPGVTPIQAMYIEDRWKTLVATYKALDFLQDLDLPKHVIRRIWSMFGDEAKEILTQNPWELVRVDGITFEQADKVAQKLGLPDNSPDRARGAILYSCKGARNDGHLYLSTGDLRNRLSAYMATEPAVIAQALRKCSDDGTLVIDRKTKENVTAIYEPWFHSMERLSAALMAQRMRTARIEGDLIGEYTKRLSRTGEKAKAAFESTPDDLVAVAKAAIVDWQESDHLVLGEDQVQGVLNAIVSPVSIITGLPGTGKTTSVKGLVRILQESGIQFLLISPTGIAAKRLSSVSGAEAHTIHRAFEAKGINEKDRKAGYVGITGQADKAMTDGSEQLWGYGPGHYYPADVVIVDESSMVDQHLMFRILSCTAPECRVVLIGDAAQLPSVGPGNVLRVLGTSKHIPRVSLTKIYRQDEASDIILGAHKIHAGKVPTFAYGASKDFRFVEFSKEAEVQAALVKLIETLYAKRSNFQCLSPKHGDALGVTTLNQIIRERLNPAAESRAEARIGSWTMREGDRVMVAKNNYELMIFNGDTGKVQKINHRDKRVLIKIHGPPVMQVELEFKEVAKYLRLAYCVTIHKMQGLEADIIVMPFVRKFWRQLQRNLLYTAVTRARKKVIMIGQRSALVRAVENDTERRRNTLLVERINHFIDHPDEVDALVANMSPVGEVPEVEFEDL